MRKKAGKWKIEVGNVKHLSWSFCCMCAQENEPFPCFNTIIKGKLFSLLPGRKLAINRKWQFNYGTRICDLIKEEILLFPRVFHSEISSVVAVGWLHQRKICIAAGKFGVETEKHFSVERGTEKIQLLPNSREKIYKLQHFISLNFSFSDCQTEIVCVKQKIQDISTF